MDTKTAPTKTPAPVTVSEPEIATRAYEIFLSRGALHGYDLDDWLQAERELTSTAETTKVRATGA